LHYSVLSELLCVIWTTRYYYELLCVIWTIRYYYGLPRVTLNYLELLCSMHVSKNLCFRLIIYFRKLISYITRLYGHICVYLPN
ncbi:unnamed protein product, partial [Brassica napus]